MGWACRTKRSSSSARRIRSIAPRRSSVEDAQPGATMAMRSRPASFAAYMAASAPESSSCTVARSSSTRAMPTLTRQVHLAAIHHQRQVAHRLEQRVGGGLGPHRVGTRQQRSELVAAQPRQDAPGAQGPLRQPGHGLQRLVACPVAEAVVDQLEVVEVEDQHRPVRTAGAGQVRRQALLEAAAVDQAGDRVVVGEVAQLGLEALSLGYVARHARDAGDGAGGVEDRRRGQRHVDPAVAAPQRDGLAPGHPLARPHPLERAAEGLAGLGLQGDQRDGPPQRLVAGVAEQPLGAGVPGLDPAVGGEGEDRVVGGLDHRASRRASASASWRSSRSASRSARRLSISASACSSDGLPRLGRRRLAQGQLDDVAVVHGPPVISRTSRGSCAAGGLLQAGGARP